MRYRLDNGERRYASDKDFIYNSAMTLTVDLDTWFEVTAHLYPKALCLGSLNQIWPREKKIFSGQANSNRETDHYREPVERGSNENYNNFFLSNADSRNVS